MNFKHFISKQSIFTKLKTPEKFIRHLSTQSQLLTTPKTPNPQNPNFTREIHRIQVSNFSTAKIFNDPRLDSDDPEVEDATLNEFLSRFVWVMRGKLREAYPESDKQTVDAMLLVIVGNVVEEIGKGGIEFMLGGGSGRDGDGRVRDGEFSEDLWRTVWEVSDKVLGDMNRERKKERMKGFLQSEEVKEMWRFAGEIGIKGDMLRELRFKWAREKMEESEFYERLESLRKEASAEENEREGGEVLKLGEGVVHGGEEKGESKVTELPKRHGKFKYRIYGLDLSDQKWVEVADRVHEEEDKTWPEEPKAISGKCKLVMEKILNLKEKDNPAPLLAEYVGLLEPSRVDWMSLLDKLKEKDIRIYCKVAELLLTEKSYQTDIRDYSKLIEMHAKENRVEDAERILKKMNDAGLVPDILTATALLHMYSKIGNLDRAKETFESLRSQGFKPDMKTYSCMITAYIKSGEPKQAEMLILDMEARDLKPTKEIYMALLRAFSQRGDISGASRISTTMQFAGFQPDLDTYTLLIEACGQAGDADQARSNFDYMIKLGFRPDDKCTSIMIAAYEKKNLLDKALHLLLQLEKDGFEPGVATYTVLVDWLGRLQLVDEAEQLLGKISEMGEAPPFKVHVSLCSMYSSMRNEKKALQSLGVLEARKQELGQEEFERIIKALTEGGFLKEAERVCGLMKSQGYTYTEKKLFKKASQSITRERNIR